MSDPVVDAVKVAVETEAKTLRQRAVAYVLAFLKRIF